MRERTATVTVLAVLLLLCGGIAAAAPDAGAVAASLPAATAPTATTPTVAADQQVFWQVLLSELLKVFLVIFVPVLSTLVVSLLRRWKVNIEYQQVASIAEKAAGWAEHKALAALKEGKPKTPGAEKMKLALDFANGLAAQYKLPSKATTKLQELIESAILKPAGSKPEG